MIPEAQRIASGYECLLSDLRALPDDPTVVSLDDRASAATFYTCNRLLHVPPTRVPIGGRLATDTDFAAADRAFEKCRKDDPIVVPIAAIGWSFLKPTCSTGPVRAGSNPGMKIDGST